MRGRETDAVDLEALQKRQDEAFGLTRAAPITTARGAARFLARVAIALRYGPTPSLPLASLYRALAGPRSDKAAMAAAIALTNRLLGEAHGVEGNPGGRGFTFAHWSRFLALLRGLSKRLGVSARAVERALFAAHRARQSGTLYAVGNRYRPDAR